MPDSDDSDSLSALDSASDDADSAPKNGSPSCPGLTWFRMAIADEDGEPMAGEDYEVVDSAGATHKGKLDANGEFYIPAILPKGLCSITFPNIHLNPRKKNQ